jgi:hypothetical protein
VSSLGHVVFRPVEAIRDKGNSGGWNQAEFQLGSEVLLGMAKRENLEGVWYLGGATEGIKALDRDVAVHGSHIANISNSDRAPTDFSHSRWSRGHEVRWLGFCMRTHEMPVLIAHI